MNISYKKRLENVCNQKKSRLCIGLDFDLDTMINFKWLLQKEWLNGYSGYSIYIRPLFGDY